jgi:hypothetical protein
MDKGLAGQKRRVKTWRAFFIAHFSFFRRAFFFSLLLRLEKLRIALPAHSFRVLTNKPNVLDCASCVLIEFGADTPTKIALNAHALRR